MGVRNTKPLNTETKEANIFILIDDFKLRLNKHILFSASPYFNAMCNGTLNSAFQNEFRLKKVNPNRIARLIDYINGNRKVMDVHNVLDILLDAKRLICPGVVQDCEEFIDKHLHEMDVVEVLELALEHEFNYLEQIIHKAVFRIVRTKTKCHNLNVFEELTLRKSKLSLDAQRFLEKLSTSYYSKVSTNPKEYEIVLNVENQAFQIDGELLISASPYFAAMLNGNFIEKNTSEIEVNEVEPAVFKLLLDYTKGDFDVITVSNVLDLLEIAGRFDFPDIVTHCEKLIRTHLQCTKDMKYNLLKPKYLELDYFDVLETAVKISNENLLDLLSKRFDQFVILENQRFDFYFVTVVTRRRDKLSEGAQNFLGKKLEELKELQQGKENNNEIEWFRKPTEDLIYDPKVNYTLRNSTNYYEY